MFRGSLLRRSFSRRHSFLSVFFSRSHVIFWW